MSCDYLALAVSGVQKLSPYIPGKPVSELERELGISNIIKLASNENPLGPSEKAIAAIQSALPELTRYPDGNGFELKKALADKLQVNTNQITLGNGSNDVLEIIARAFLDTSSEAVFSEYAFAVYPIVTQAVGAKAVVTPAKNWGHDLAAMAAAITERTKLIFIANPNNPTGTWFTQAEWEAFLAAVPERVIIVLDEAYIEYADSGDAIDGAAYLSQYPNLIVSRTFSKAYGLASLRVGYCASNADIADVLNRVRQPFNVNSLALAAAVASLADADYLKRSRQINDAGMQQLVDGFRALQLSFIPSGGNFVCVDVEQAAGPIYQALLKEGVITRPVSNYGIPNHLRISIGLPEENQRFLAALKKVLGK